MQTIELTKHSKLVEFSHALSAAANDLERYPVLKEHAAAFNSLAHDLLLPPIVVVMGAFNAGKSTLLNAMLGQNLLNMHVLPATATVTMLRKGTSGAFYGHTDGQPVRKWPASDLVSLSAEGDTAAADIRRSLSYIEVPLEVPLLDKVTLVDTPGLNSPNEAHTRATEEFVHRAHTVLWIVSCLSALNEHERSWIEGLPDGLKVMVVVNQIDLLDPEENSLPRVIERIQNNLQRPDLTVTAVSAKLALESRLQANPKIYAESLWDRFEADFDSQIIQSDPEPQLRKAISHAAALLESLDMTIAGHLKEADRLRMQAKGGDEYHQDLQGRISALAGAEHSLVHSSDSQMAIQSCELPPEWNVPANLRLKREVLIGAIIALESDHSKLGNDVADFNSRAQTCEAEIKQWLLDQEAYNTSGLFGGAPVIFDGKKKKLEARKERLEKKKVALTVEQNALEARNDAHKKRDKRIENDCKSFVDEIIQALRAAMASVVKESRDTVEQQKIAALKLDELMWIPAFARQVQDKSFWMLPTLASSTDVDESREVRFGASLDIFHRTVDRILQNTWTLSIPRPLVEPDALKKRASLALSRTTVRVESRAAWKAVWVIAGIAAMLLVVFLSMRNAPQQPQQSLTVESAQPQPNASSLAVVPTIVPNDDRSVIVAALSTEDYVPDGPLFDIQGIGTGPALYAQKVSCSGVKQSCEKLFVFVGPRAVWSEDIASSAALSNITATGPGQFSVRVKSQLPDSTETSGTVSYKWDGSSLSRTDDTSIGSSAIPAETANEDQAASGAAVFPASPNVPTESLPTADTENQQGIAFANAHQYDLAIAAFNRGIQLNSARADLYNNRGAMFANKGDARGAISDYDQALRLNSNYPEALGNRGNAYSQLGDYAHAIADYDRAIQLNPSLTFAVTNRRIALLKQTQQSQVGPSYPLPSSLASSSGNSYSAPIVRKPPSAYEPRSVKGASYDDTLQSARTAFQRKDLRGAYQLATQARDLEPNSLPALELLQVILAEAGDQAQAESAALEAIKHGGKAVFELQHFHAWPTGLHAARLVITSGSLEFIPEAPCKYADFTIPLASIKSVDMGENTLAVYLLNIKFDDSHERKGKEAKGQISFTGPSSRLDSSSSAYHVSSQRSMSQDTALFSAIRNVILTAKGRL
jgi:small GTP-binding protein